MKNNIKKAPVKFWEDLLYFQHFMQIFVFALNYDYHHLNNNCTGLRPAVAVFITLLYLVTEILCLVIL